MVNKSAKRDESPQKSGKKEHARTYRKSPARTVKKSPSRVVTNSPPLSPQPRRALRKSPSRVVPETPKSPTRKSPSRKSPSRKSPSRKSTSRVSPARTPSSRLDRGDSNVSEKITRQSTKTRYIEVESESDDDLQSRITAEKPEALVRGRPRKASSPQVFLQNIIPKYKEPTPVKTEVGSYMNLMRRSTTKSQPREIDHIINFKRESSTSSIQKLTELSDEDETFKKDVREKSVRKSEPRSLEKITPHEFGRLRSLLYVILVLLIPITFSVYCNDKQCSFTKSPNVDQYKSMGAYFDSTILAITFAFVSLVAILGALPFGGKKISGLPNKQSRLDYTMNGFFTLTIIGVVLIALEISGTRVIEKILKKYFQLFISLTVFGIFLSVYFYIRSFYVPLCSLKSDVLLNSGIYNFFHGREVNPRILKVIDIKFSLLRFCCIFAVLLNASLVCKNISFKILTDGDIDYKSIKFNLTLIVLAVMQIAYYIDVLIFEPSFVSTSTVQYQAVGYEYTMFMTVGPLIGIAASKYVFDYSIERSLWQLSISFIIFLVGYTLYRKSNSQKHSFRLNPYSSSVSHLETLATSQGRKLLVAGYWGLVRHPNYLGNILIQIAFGLIVCNSIPVLVYIFDIFILFNRVTREEIKCKQKYGSAWDRYCQRVKYSLIPKVY